MEFKFEDFAGAVEDGYSGGPMCNDMTVGWRREHVFSDCRLPSTTARTSGIRSVDIRPT